MEQIQSERLLQASGLQRQPEKRSIVSASRQGGALTREALVDVVMSACWSLSRAEARDVLEITIDEIVAALLGDGMAKLGAFGAFRVRSRSERIDRNPRTGVEAKIDARRDLTDTSSLKRCAPA